MIDTTSPRKSIQKEIPLDVRLCDACIGRLFSSTINQEDYTELGRNIRIKKKMVSVAYEDCTLCEGLSNGKEHYISMVKQALEGYEYSTFLIGLHIHEDILSEEQSIMQLTDATEKETLKNYLNRCIGLALEKELGKEVHFADPDIMVIIDTTFDVISLQIKSLFIYGRYQKYKRGIPQTKWFCRSCRGKGCRDCEYSGTRYDSSVEGLIAEPFLKQTLGLDESFHGAGREDIDVRMLGNGRPFVLEIKQPQKRTIDFQSIQSQINKKYTDVISVHQLDYTHKETIARLKEGHFSKIYRVTFEGNHPIEKEKLKKVAQTLRGNTINQFTPTRVELRRAKMVRARKIYDCRVDKVNGNKVVYIIEAESGTYIKEIVTGDNGRTQPNISDLLGVPCIVCSLDVLEIKGE
jgi:tRNA pseudouridine synthase 10